MCEAVVCAASIYSCMYHWSAKAGGWEYSKWRQSRDLRTQPVGYCVWWPLGKHWCCCCVSPTGLLYSRSATGNCLIVSFKNIICIMKYQQVQWPSPLLTLVVVLDQFTWTMLIAVAVRVDSQTAHVVQVPVVGLVTMKMLVWDVKASLCSIAKKTSLLNILSYNYYYCKIAL